MSTLTKNRQLILLLILHIEFLNSLCQQKGESQSLR